MFSLEILPISTDTSLKIKMPNSFPQYSDYELLHYNQLNSVIVQRAKSIQDPDTSVILKGVTLFSINENNKLQMEYDILTAIHTKLKRYEERSEKLPGPDTYESRLFQSLLEGVPIRNAGLHITKPVGLLKKNDNFVLVLEDFKGKSLREFRAESQSVNLEEFLEIALQVAESLDIIHCMGLIHRDISPDNVIIKYVEGKLQLQVIDFNLARYNRPGQESSDSFKGTLAYMSPGINFFLINRANGTNRATTRPTYRLLLTRSNAMGVFDWSTTF
jgi:serine/threonine protein kinase